MAGHVVSREFLEDLGEALIAAAPQAERERFGPPIREGFNNLTHELQHVLTALQNTLLRGKYLNGVGKTEWADLTWKDSSMVDKTHLINSADFVFTPAASIGNYVTAKTALEAGVNSKVLDCSDAHELSSSSQKDRVGNCWTWLKLVPTFQGLKQIAQEFDQRVFVGKEPEQKRRLRGNFRVLTARDVRQRVFKSKDARLTHDGYPAPTGKCGEFSSCGGNRYSERSGAHLLHHSTS